MTEPVHPTAEERGVIRRWAETWKRAGPLIEETRAAEIRATDTVSAMEILDGMFTHAVETLPPRESSGLLEQQAIFARARK